MLKTTLIMLTAIVVCYTSGAFADATMLRGPENGYYYQYRVKGYDLQPPEYWVRECGNAQHKCVSNSWYSRYHGTSYRPQVTIREMNMFRDHH